MAEQQYNTDATPVGTGLHTDNDALNQPQGTNRFVLNAVNEAKDGQQGGLSNERANFSCTTKPSGYDIIGDKYLEDDTSVLILVNPTTGRDEIGIIQKNDEYTTLVDTAVLNLNIANQCQIVYRLRRGKERVIYWVDGLNRPRLFNLDRPYNFYNATYQAYLRAGGNPNTYVGEKWDAASFDLIKSYSKIPFFNNVQILESGSILPGSYNFAVQYVDEDLNPTVWITTSNTVNIFNDSTSRSYGSIRGSRNVESFSQSFKRANKSIKLTITNLDNAFPYYRVAIIRSAQNIGEVDEVLASDLYSTADSNFIYTGNDGNLTKTKLSDILVDSEVIFAPQHIEQLENRLLLLNTRGKGINWCEFQAYASKIESDLTTKPVILNNVISEPNVKNAKSTFFYRGYMPGEVYSFGICYIFADGTVSPTFHIPGKNILNLTSKMKYHEIDNRYLDIHNCSTQNYWAKDAYNESLLGKKIRHHRFPFRKDVNKPLYGTTGTNITVDRYKLTVTIDLNPAWTPGPIAYPVDGNGDPLVIPYGIEYQVGTSPTVDVFSGLLVDTDMGVPITIYDDLTALVQVNPPDYGELDATSILATVYQIALNERFILTFDYTVTPVSSTINNDTSEIFGITFSNIEKPHPDVIGCYIVRNERQEDDRIILDNAIFGILLENLQYKAFGHIMPKQLEPATNCGTYHDPGRTLQFYDQAAWFYNPEYQYFGKKTEFDSVEIEGTYTENKLEYPALNNNGECNVGKSLGLYISDVQAGTSYDPAVHKKKNKDDDGFDLLIGFSNINVSYAINNSFVYPVKNKIIYLNGASYQNDGANTFYNVSVDNKIGMLLLNSTINTDLFYNPATKRNALMYGSLIKSNTSAYSNFLTRTYYKEHNNPILFGNNSVINNVSIFNGDAMISAFTFISSLFYDMVVADRKKKSQLWKIIVGVILIVVGVILIWVYGLGVGPLIAGVGLISATFVLAVAVGISLVMAGVKFEQFKNMITVDYEKGLIECVIDQKIHKTIRWPLERDDDTIRWFADRVSNIYMESAVPFGLRSGLTCGIPDFIDSPAPYSEEEFRTYLTEKLTTIDRDQGSGRLYRGFSTAEVYDMNLDFMRFNKQKNFIHLPIEYDCCSDDNEVYPLRAWYSEQSFQEEKIDNYRVFLPNNYRDIEGEHGEITNAYRLGNNLFIHTKEGLWQLPQNLQERVTSEIVSFIGTGDFFNVPPRKVMDDTLGSGGSQHKWATVKTRNGVMFVNEVEGKVYLHAEGVQDVSIRGMRNWFENNLKDNLSKQLFDNLNVEYKFKNNPANALGVGYLSTYDTRYERILITKRDYLIVPEKLAQLVVSDIIPVVGTQFIYCTLNGFFYQGTTQIFLDDTDYFENKSWTISYSFNNNPKLPWVSWHSYMPNYYIHSQNNLYSVLAGGVDVFKHHSDEKFQTFYNTYYPFIIEYVSKSKGLQDATFESLTIQSSAKRWDTVDKEYIDEGYITFNKVLVYNRKQSSGELEMIVKDTQPNPENWYQQQLTNTPGTILITKKEQNWNVNEFRDNVIDYSKPLFTTAWNAIKVDYYIDKVVNNAVISYIKPWEDLQNFRDKYIVIRLKFDNFDNVNLLLNYSLETEQASTR